MHSSRALCHLASSIPEKIARAKSLPHACCLLADRLRSPCRHAFIRLRSLPSGVRGPVERVQGRVRAADARRDARPLGESR